MNEVQIEKKVFVDSYLAPLLVFATDGEIRFAKYLVSGADERVEIRFPTPYAVPSTGRAHAPRGCAHTRNPVRTHLLFVQRSPSTLT